MSIHAVVSAHRRTSTRCTALADCAAGHGSRAASTARAAQPGPFAAPGAAAPPSPCSRVRGQSRWAALWTGVDLPAGAALAPGTTLAQAWHKLVMLITETDGSIADAVSCTASSGAPTGPRPQLRALLWRRSYLLRRSVSCSPLRLWRSASYSLLRLYPVPPSSSVHPRPFVPSPVRHARVLCVRPATHFSRSESTREICTNKPSSSSAPHPYCPSDQQVASSTGDFALYYLRGSGGRLPRVGELVKVLGTPGHSCLQLCDTQRAWVLAHVRSCSDCGGSVNAMQILCDHARGHGAQTPLCKVGR